MTREAFFDLVNSRIVVLDGATGSNLMCAGMPAGVCTEEWVLEHPDVLIQLQQEYVDAGADIVYAPTFSANRIKLAQHHLQDRIQQINYDLVQLSKQATQGRALVAGDMTMTGEALEPLSALTFQQLIDIYKEQTEALLSAGVDLIVIETMLSQRECRAAVLAVRSVSDIPIMVSLTFDEHGRTMYGNTPESVVVTLQSLGVDAVGMNCSTGPREMIPYIKRMHAVANIPVFAKPNAGVPVLENHVTMFKMTPEEFAQEGVALLEAGACMIGGCCGTTPEHIRMLCKAIEPAKTSAQKENVPNAISSERGICILSTDRMDTIFVPDEEQLEQLESDIMQDDMDLVSDIIMDQTEEEPDYVLFDFSWCPGITVNKVKDIILEITSATTLPLCIGTSNAELLQEALIQYPGRAAVSITTENPADVGILEAIATKYGAMILKK